VTRVAVIGHIESVDFLPVPRLPHPGEVMHADAGFTRAAGGGGVAAAALANLGAEVDFFSALGDDAAGRAALAQLEERGIRVHVAWREEPTRRAVTLLEPGGERTIITIGKRLEPRGSDDLDWERLRGAASVYFTAGDADALQNARQAGVVVASPRARDVLGTGAGRLDALVYSESDHDERAWAERAAPHARVVVATEGDRGGRWWGESQGRWAAAPLPGRPRDAYGAGDSFAAAFTLGLGRGDSIAEAAALGARAGARALTRVGAP
jgi:ribokinase